MSKHLLQPGISAAMNSNAVLADEFGLDEFRPGWARPYATSGFSPFWYASGDEEDDEDEEDDDKVEDDEEDDEDEDDEDKGKTPEELAAEVKRLRAAYLKKMKNSKNRGQRLRDAEAAKTKLEADYASLQSQLDDLKKTSGTEVDSEAAQKRISELIDKAREEGKKDYLPVVVRMAAKAELMAAGARPALVDRLVRMIDVAEADVEEDGTIDVSDQVDALKKDMPEMFGPKRATAARTRRKVTGEEGEEKSSKAASSKKAGGASGGDEGAVEVKLTAAQKVANRLRGIN